MNVTTGTILVNARYKRINGYDCFVNMEDNYDNPKAQDNIILRDSGNFPAITTIPSTVHIDSSNTKISAKSMCVKNQYFYYTYYTDKFGAGNSTADWTLAFWGKYKFLNSPNVRMTVAAGYLDIGQVRDHVNTTSAIVYEKKPDGLHPISGQSVPENTWVHLMYTKKGNNLYLFKNGTLVKTDTTQSGFTISNPMGFRAYHVEAYYDDIVLIEGECLTTTGYTVPTNSYLIDKNYDNTTLGPNNIMYPPTIAEANKIFDIKNSLKQY